MQGAAAPRTPAIVVLWLSNVAKLTAIELVLANNAGPVDEDGPQLAATLKLKSHQRPHFASVSQAVTSPGLNFAADVVASCQEAPVVQQSPQPAATLKMKPCQRPRFTSVSHAARAAANTRP